ncbi:MAG: beta-hydroxyacyl-ACP dehydratase, partial [Terriglobia bacterium]
MTPPPPVLANISRILPHRYPFLLIDRITEFVPATRIAGIKTFTAN